MPEPHKDIRQLGMEAEEAYGFAEAVKVGDTIYISGQTAYVGQGHIVGVGDMAAQMRQAYTTIATLLEGYGATMRNVVDETLFVTDIAAASQAARTVRKEAYGGVFEVASTLIGVAELGAPELLIEIRCTARV